MSSAMKIPLPVERGKLMSVDDVREWIEARMPGRKRSRAYVYKYLPHELRVSIGRGLFWWEDDVEGWFLEQTRGKR